MSTEKDVIKAKNALQKAMEDKNEADLTGILDTLSKVTATHELLKNTEIGKTLGRLRTHDNAAIAQKAKDIIRKWKEDVLQNNKQSEAIKKTPTPPPASKSSVDGNPKPRTIKSDNVSFDSTGVGPRDKTIELIYASLGVETFAEADLLLQRALDIEAALFKQFSEVNNDYKQKVRSLSLNLKNKSNPDLRESVINGELEVEKLCKMSVEEMASEEAKARDRKLAEDALSKARTAQVKHAVTDMFRCGRCGERKCTYYQMQTRSADEPMTTFVTCTVCNKRWRM